MKRVAVFIPEDWTLDELIEEVKRKYPHHQDLIDSFTALKREREAKVERKPDDR